MSFPSVSIVGAGIGGLTAALALQKRGISVRIFEQARQLGEIGAGLHLSPNGLKVLYALGLKNAIEKIKFQPQTIAIRHYQSGEPFFENPFDDNFRSTFGAPFYGFHRADLHKMLLEAVQENDAACIEVGMRLTQLREDDKEVKLDFEGGETRSSSILLGADGVHSTVRTLRHPQLGAQYTGHVAYRGMVSVKDVASDLIEPKMNLWAGPAAHVVAYYVRRGELLNYVALTEEDDWQTENWTTQADKATLAARFENWNDTVKALIDHTQNGQCYKWAILMRDPLESWSSARTTLLGDAAHPMVPYLAQGSVMAIEDAWVLAHCIATINDPGNALQTYEAARLERTANIQRAAWKQGQLTHAVGRGNDMSERRDGGGFADSAWIYGYDACDLFPA
ncbi:MAG: FAD-dependent monooxygenase [Proteobacteria bacterium]|nr:FAD-dependent monooxygenase [Pseudomonadota bacterium]